MGLSETIIAAIIGALATMVTAIAQLLRHRVPPESRPKKSRIRSTFAIVALVMGAMVGGYFWSELRSVGAKEEIAALRADLKLAARPADVASDTTASQEPPTGAALNAIPAVHASTGSAESMAHLPPCQLTPQAEDAGPTTCTDALATKIALCASIPAAAHPTAIRVQARAPKSESPWIERETDAPTIGNLHVAPEHVEYAASPETRSVCLDMANFSVEDAVAVRVIVDYALAPPPATELTAAAPSVM